MESDHDCKVQRLFCRADLNWAIVSEILKADIKN